MIQQEISELQINYNNAVESVQLTTIHLINSNKIFTDTDVYKDGDDSENVFGDFFCSIL